VAAFVVLAVGLTWAAARSVLGSSGLATVAAGVAVVLGLGGLPQPGWSVLSDPPSATLQLAFPALLAVAAAYAARPAGDTLAALTAASLAVTLLHPTYLLYAAVVLTGAVVAGASRPEASACDRSRRAPQPWPCRSWPTACGSCR
jgi:hypothetical protein